MSAGGPARTWEAHCTYQITPRSCGGQTLPRIASEALCRISALESEAGEVGGWHLWLSPLVILAHPVILEFAIQPGGLSENSRWQAPRRPIRINLRKLVFKKNLNPGAMNLNPGAMHLKHTTSLARQEAVKKIHYSGSCRNVRAESPVVHPTLCL